VARVVFVPTSAQTPAPSRARGRARARGSAVARHPAAAGTFVRVHHERLPAGDRCRGDHRHDLRTTCADDARQRWPRALNRARAERQSGSADPAPADFWSGHQPQPGRPTNKPLIPAADAAVTVRCAVLEDERPRHPALGRTGGNRQSDCVSAATGGGSAVRRQPCPVPACPVPAIVVYSGGRQKCTGRERTTVPDGCTWPT
jgi:hypothetical protein